MTHPFSGKGINDLIYDLYLQGRIPDFYNPKIVFAPTGREIGLAGSLRVSEQGSDTWMVRNIPEFLDLAFSPASGQWKIKHIPQYKGYGIRLSRFRDSKELLAHQFSSRNRRKLRANLRKLEESGNMQYTIHYGAMDWEEHVELFARFYDLLKERFDEIGMYNRNLIHWPYFCLSTYRGIQEKSAFLLVVKKDGQPIAFSLNYIRDKLVFGIFQTYDVKFSEYGMGDICMLRKMDWCFERGFHFYDLSIGWNYFKEKWADYAYSFEYHLFYRDTARGRLKANLLENALLLRQRLRDWGILGKWFEFDKFFYGRQVRRLEGFDWRQAMEALMDPSHPPARG